MKGPGSIEVCQDGNVAVVTLVSSGKLNAISLSMYKRINTLFDSLSNNDEVHCIVLTGAEGNFSAGGDISEFSNNRFDPEQAAIYDSHSDAAAQAILNCPKPVIAAIDGYAIGGGYLLALACDLRVAGSGAKIGMPPAKLGLVYSMSDTGLVLRVLSPSVARLMLFSARNFEARQAYEMGMVDMISREGAMEEAMALARDIAANYPDAVRGAKRVLGYFRGGRDPLPDAAGGDLLELQQASAGGSDYHDAVHRFTRKP